MSAIGQLTNETEQRALEDVAIGAMGTAFAGKHTTSLVIPLILKAAFLQRHPTP